MWQSIDYKGFEIHVLPAPAYGPAPAGVPYSYVGYVCRPGADIRVGGQQVFFSHALATFASEDDAWQDGYNVGMSIIDGTHPHCSVDGL